MMVEAEGPADTRIMGVVHAALRRDLDRTGRELTTAPYPAARQRRALGGHVLWMMSFLHDHHTNEDTGLWPLVRERNPEAAALLDRLEADHQRIAPRIKDLEAAASSYAESTDDRARLRLVDALDALTDVLVPHLDREVEEAMPVVARSITAREWEEWDQRYNVKGRSARQLGLVGHFLIDGVAEESRRLVVSLVPPVPRFVLLHGFAHTYRRAAAARWRTETAVRTSTVVAGRG
jgi:hypothetical protein